MSSQEPSTSKRIVIAGGSGFLGMSLAEHLQSLGYKVIVLSRNPQNAPGVRFAQWDGRTLGDWVSELEGCHAVVNLAGRTVDCIKTPLNCDQILRSRVESTRILGQAIQSLKNKPSVWVQMSTAHIYGDSQLQCTETSATGFGLAPIVGRAWEEVFGESCPDGIRQVVLRTSFVLGKRAPAWKKLSGVTRLGFGGTISTGKQGMSWIHELDMNRIFEKAIEDSSMQGIYISSAPNPISNKDFMQSMRKHHGMPIGLPAAAWMIKIGAKMVLKTDPELAIYGRYVLPQRLMDEGFDFTYPTLDAGLMDLVKKDNTK